MPIGQEITLCELQEKDYKLTGRCLNEEKGIWNIRLLYEESYQMFDWKLVYHEQFLPQMMPADEEGIPAKSLWVKCCQRDADGRARWNLHLLWRDGAIYKDIAFDTLSYIRQLEESYEMEYEEDTDAVLLLRKTGADEEVCPEKLKIPHAGMEAKSQRIRFGGLIMFEMEEKTVYFSIGAEYEELALGQMGSYYVAGHYAGGLDGIYCRDLRIIEKA